MQDYTVNAEKASLQSVSPVISLTPTDSVINNMFITIELHNIVTSVDEQLNYETLNSILYYPNPVKDNLNIVFNLEKQAMVEVSVINITGQEIKKYNYSLSEGSNNISMDMSDIKPGIYFVRLNANNGNVANFKIVK